MKGSIEGRYGKIYSYISGERYEEIHIWSEDMGWRAGVLIYGTYLLKMLRKCMERCTQGTYEG
jgi:hypothetical protein